MFNGSASLAQTQSIEFSSKIKDYGPVFTEKIQSLIKSKGGTLYVDQNTYPVLTPILINYNGDSITINIVGKKNKKGNLPILIDTDTSRVPHAFFGFQSNIVKPTLTFTMSNLELVGNNVPYSKQHPFYGNIKNSYSAAISGLNLVTCSIDNVVIKNFYGTGIILANYYNTGRIKKKSRMESPKITNCKILNVWCYNSKDQSGDGISFWAVNKAVVQNNVILNNIPTTRFGGRAGLVLEHYTENAIVKDNTIGGYNRNIHIECDYGGHMITKNTFTQSSIAITLSEDCRQSEEDKSAFSPITIKSNVMKYNQEFKKYNIGKADYAFISIYRPSFVLDGLTIIDNIMSYSIDKTLDQRKTSERVVKKADNIFIDLKGQQNVIVRGNKFN